jgi:nucleoside transporter
MTLNGYRFRLSAMMFGQYLIIGSWAVTLGTFLMSSPLKGGMHFPPSYAGWLYSTLALAGIIAPMFIGLLADRLFAAEKLMGCLHLLSAVLLGAAAWWCLGQQPKIKNDYRTAASAESIDGVPILEMEHRLASSPAEATPELREALKLAFERVDRSPLLANRLRETFITLFLLMFGYAFCYITTLTLSNVIVFRNLLDAQRSFGKIRLYGTVGWIVAGIQLELFWNTISPGPLFFAAATSVAFGLFCFSLPNTPSSGWSKSFGEAIGLPALSMFRERSFTVLIVCTLFISAVQQFYGVYMNRYLRELGTPYPAAVQTLAQMAEVTCMMLSPFFLLRFGVKTTMGIGLACWFLRNGLFATAAPVLVILGLPLHGISYAFFIVVASMYVDGKAPLHLRASAQGVFSFVSLGAGTLLGNWLSAIVVESQTFGDLVSWTGVWLAPTFMSAGVLAAYVILFHDPGNGPFRSPVESA